MKIPMDKLVTIVRGGREIPCDPGTEYAEEEVILTGKLPLAHSCELAESKKTNYRTALYITKDGFVPGSSASKAIAGGSFDDSCADSLTLDSTSTDFSAVIVDGGKYSVKNAKIRMTSDADGKDTCDFVGLGSAVGAFNGARVNIENCEIATTGVARCTVFCDNGSDVVIRDSRLSALGGKLFHRQQQTFFALLRGKQFQTPFGRQFDVITHSIGVSRRFARQCLVCARYAF